MKRYRYVVLGLIAFSLFFPIATFTQVRAADGTVGSLQANSDFLIAGMPLTLRAYSLTGGADYLLNHTNDDTGYPFTAPSDGDWQITIPNIARPSSGSTVTFYLRQQSAGTEITAVTVTVFNLSDFLVTGLIVTMGVFILVIVIVKRVMD